MYTCDTLGNVIFEHSDDHPNYVSKLHLCLPLLLWKKLEYSKFNLKSTTILICFITFFFLISRTEFIS